HHLARKERPDLAEPGHRRARREHRAARVEHHPDLTVPRDDRRLVDEAEEAAVIASRLRRRPFRRSRDVRDDLERQPAVGAQRDRHGVLSLEEIGHEEVPVAIEREARVATRISERVVRAETDKPPRPRLPTVETHRQEHARSQTGLAVTDVREDDDVFRVCRIDGDRLLRLVEVPLAYVDVEWGRRCRDRSRHGCERGGGREKAQCEKPTMHVSPPSRRRDPTPDANCGVPPSRTYSRWTCSPALL